MGDDPLLTADRFFAEGDYLRALDELRKASTLDPEISRRIHTALDRMKAVAARELAEGRWSVAEGIVDAVQEHERFLSSAQRRECRLLVDELRRCRDLERQLEGVLQAATALAAESRFSEAREVALQMMGGCADGTLLARLRRILRDLPHPLGRLIYGFDSPMEVEMFVRPRAGASVEAVSEESHPLGGGYLRARLPRSGAAIELVDSPSDWSDVRELNVCARLVMPGRGRIRISAGDARGAWTHDARILDPYWNLVRVPLDQFVRGGEADWRSLTRFEIASAGPEPMELMIDEIRLRSKPA